MTAEPLLAFGDALARLLSRVRPVGAERVPLEDAAGRVLAESLIASEPMPAFDYSAMDGYAVAAGDLPGSGPWSLPISGEASAGGDPPDLVAGTACRIYTGARLPRGADAVVMQEAVAVRDGVAELRTAPHPGAFIRRAGADLAEGTIALARGTRLCPGHLALAGALDRPTLFVARRPIVSVLCSGDELRSPGEPGRPGSIAESNGIFVAAAARGAGAIARILPFVRDDLGATTQAVTEALRASDLVVTVGGVSVGDRDVVRPALEACSVTLDFWRVAIKPGKPLAVGRAGATHVLGLPGNPASASLTFLLFGLPLLRTLQSDAAPLPPRREVRVTGAYGRAPGRQEFLRARLAPGEARAELLSNQASGAVVSFAQADALVVVPAEHGDVLDGEPLECIRLSEI